MNISLDFKQVLGSVTIPASKSISQRLCAAALLHNGVTVIRHFGHSDDELAALNIIQELGAKLTLLDSQTISIDSLGIIQNAHTIDCGESGLSARLFTPIAAMQKEPITITGGGSLLKRPMHFLADVFPQLQVSLLDFDGHLPFTVCGPLIANSLKVDGSISSQFISGLLFAFAHSSTEISEIEVEDLVSKPYVDLTLEVLAMFGKKITHHNHQVFTINPDLFTSIGDVNVTIESDWSSAAFWIAAATIRGSLALVGLNKNSAQADKLMLEIVESIGTHLFWEDDILRISSAGLHAFEADLTDAPDLFPVLAILAACCSGQSRIKGLHRLIHKESNRAESISHLLSQLDVTFSVENDTLIIVGATSFRPIKYNCPNDHRMAMAAALVAMKCEGKIEIEHAECVHKSYPDFWKDVKLYGQLKGSE